MILLLGKKGKRRRWVRRKRRREKESLLGDRKQRGGREKERKKSSQDRGEFESTAELFSYLLLLKRALREGGFFSLSRQVFFSIFWLAFLILFTKKFQFDIFFATVRYALSKTLEEIQGSNKRVLYWLVTCILSTLIFNNKYLYYLSSFRY